MSKKAVETYSAWADKSHRFPEDDELRRNGFVIHARPRKGPPLWEYGGLLYTVEEALEFLDGLDEVRKK